MLSGLNEPQRVRLDSLLIARNFLLLKAPLRELDLVREQVTACHRMLQPEVRPEGPQALRRLAVPLVALVYFHDPVIVCVAWVVGHAIPRDLLLEVDIGHWWALVV